MALSKTSGTGRILGKFQEWLRMKLPTTQQIVSSESKVDTARLKYLFMPCHFKFSTADVIFLMCSPSYWVREKLSFISLFPDCLFWFYSDTLQVNADFSTFLLPPIMAFSRCRLAMKQLAIYLHGRRGLNQLIFSLICSCQTVFSLQII